MKRVIYFIFLNLFLGNLYAQETNPIAPNSVADTVFVSDSLSHSPVKATFMSMALPGLGQAYNRKYWKIPLVYALIGTPLYFALEQSKSYNDFKSAYIKRLDEDPTTIDTKYANIYTDENLLNLLQFHRGNRDLLFVLTGFAYALNIVDAAVDAHLYYFEVNDDLSGVFKPSVKYSTFDNSYIPSLTLTLKFGKNNHRQF